MEAPALTPAQQAVVDSNHRLICCISSAGSGKTLVLSERIKRLIKDGVPPGSICAVTYTTSAAYEMSTRIGYQIGLCDTLHGLCLKLLKEHGALIGFEPETMAVLSEEDSETFIQEQMRLLKFRGGIKELRLAMMGGLSDGKRVTPIDLIVGRIYHTLRRTNVLTYDAILVYALEMLRKLRGTDFETYIAGVMSIRFEHLLLDEMQDASDLDWAIYNALPVPNKFIVADPRQSLFEWRKGNPGNVLALTTRKDVETHHITENFRSGQEICDLANKLAKDFAPMRSAWPNLNPSRVDFAAFSSADAELSNITFAVKAIDPTTTCAILLRTNALVEDYGRVIRELGLPNVTVCTYHAAKSKEWDIVFLPALEEGIVPLKSDDVNECRRMLYVGITRGRRMVLLGCAKERKDPWSYDWISNAPSRYLRELGLI